MNLAALRTLLPPENISVAQEDRLVYRQDASFLRGDCQAVVWPRNVEEVCALTEWAAAEMVDLVPRGAGTGLCGGATPQHSVVVDLSHMTRLGPLDAERKTIRAESGVVLGALNRHLSPHGLFLPVIPGSHRAASIGGMIATDAAGLRAVRYGSMRNWVASLTLVDGNGRVHQLSGDQMEDAIGREGVTGFIVETVLRLTALPKQRTITLLAFDDQDKLLAQRERWLTSPHLTALEYLNPPASEAIVWAPKAHLLAEFDSSEGQIAEPQRVAELWRARDGLYPVLARQGYPVIEDPQIKNADRLRDLLTWLDSERIPVFGHLGMGIIHPCFAPGDGRVDDLYQRVADLGGSVSGEHGIGLKKKEYTGETFRAAIRRLKAVYDPHNILNRGKLC